MRTKAEQPGDKTKSSDDVLIFDFRFFDFLDEAKLGVTARSCSSGFVLNDEARGVYRPAMTSGDMKNSAIEVSELRVVTGLPDCCCNLRMTQDIGSGEVIISCGGTPWNSGIWCVPSFTNNGKDVSDNMDVADEEQGI